MKIAHRREATQAARENLCRSLQLLQKATALLEEAADSGDKSDLLRAGELWSLTVTQVKDAKELSEELLGAEIETWIKES